MPDIRLVPLVTGKAVVLSRAVVWADVNAVLQQLSQSLEVEDRRDIILCCSDLSSLRSSAEEVIRIFSSLLKMILEKRVRFPDSFYIAVAKRSTLYPLLNTAGSSFSGFNLTAIFLRAPAGYRCFKKEWQKWPQSFKK